MARVAPGGLPPVLLGPNDDAADFVSQSVRRQSTAPRFQGLPEATKALALGFRPLTKPRTRFSLSATLIVCVLLQVIVGAPYAANERAAGSAQRTAGRGLIIGIWIYFVQGPSTLISAPIMTRGDSLHPLYFLSLPITLGLSVGAAFVPVDGSTLGIISIALCSYALGYVICQFLLIAPFFATDEHKALQRSFGPPTVSVGVVFFLLIFTHLLLAQRYSSPFVGLLLPICSTVTRVLALLALVRSFHKSYYEPKHEFLTKMPSAQSQSSMTPPILGDIETAFGFQTALFGLIIGNAAAVATLVGAMIAPDSLSWVLSLAISAVLEALTRTGMMQRIELSVAALSGLEWPTRLAQTNAMKLVYLHSLGGTGYVAPTMTLCIGCLRALTFDDPAAILWLDVSPTLWHVLVAQLVFTAAVDATVWVAERRGLVHFELSARFAAGHPLRDTAFRDFDLKSYILVFGVGGMFMYAVFVAFLGPSFVMGICRDFSLNASQVWVWSGLECENATGVTNWTNATLAAVVRL
jgi:hypothetical protein